jgi:hypothetical protein
MHVVSPLYYPLLCLCLLYPLQHILLESEFAGGFLNFLLDRKNAVDDLYYLDEQLYRSLMQLKHFANAGGDVESLELYFEVSTAQNICEACCAVKIFLP